MAKSKKRVVKSKAAEENVYFETARGWMVEIRSLPPFLLDQMTANIERPLPPTYTTTLPGGEEENHFHTEQTLESDEDHIEWQKYLEALQSVSEAENEKFMQILISEGMDVAPRS